MVKLVAASCTFRNGSGINPADYTCTTLPVVGLPVPTPDLGGLDSLLSTVQMPGDVPVATMAVGMGGPRNSGLFAVQILANADPDLKAKLAEFKERLVQKIAAKNDKLLSEIGKA